MQIIYAPNECCTKKDTTIEVFLAGGLQKCDWQDEFLEEFSRLCGKKDVVVYNPKRNKYDMENPSLELEQIQWEHKHLTENANAYNHIFSMYFDNSTSPQPICFYELGRYLGITCRKNCIISVHPEFSRRNDVLIQTSLATAGTVTARLCSPTEHAQRVAMRVHEILTNGNKR